ncbi:MAG: hypothetical protein QOF78_455 [Phycisphaerales bacterium]|nr:hypothetical protein [Phycisphaerales bacterium]
MSELRTQLDLMRGEYRGERYPGDLATEILSAPSAPRALRLPVGRITAAASALVAIAAAVALWVSIKPAVESIENPNPSVAMSNDVVPVIEFASMPEIPADVQLVPADVSLVPSAESLNDIGGMPEMPSLDLNFSTQTEISEDLS